MRLWAYRDAAAYLKDYLVKGDKSYKYFIYRLTRKSKSATIIADFEERMYDHIHSPKGISKYNFRNIKFRNIK